MTECQRADRTGENRGVGTGTPSWNEAILIVGTGTGRTRYGESEHHQLGKQSISTWRPPSV